MASDEDYMAFLNKANEDPSAGVAKASSGAGMQLRSVERGEEVPEGLRGPMARGEWVYQSEADEAFVGVALRLKGGKMPDEEQFAELVKHPDPAAAGIAIQDVTEWDPQGRYGEVVQAVRDAAWGGDVRVYRVPGVGARVEYWVVGVEKDKKGGRLVGAKVLAVES